MVTKLQANMLVAIAEDELTPLNGMEPDDVDNATTFTDMVVNDAQDKGTLTSLINADLVWRAGTGRDSCVGLTDKGFVEYKLIKGANRE